MKSFFMNMNRKILFVFCGIILFNIGCVPNKSSSVSQQARQGAEAKVVNLAIWSNYIAPEQLEEFQKKTGIRVQVSNYSSNEELLAKLQAGASGYDLIVPSDYMVFAMIKLGLLQELDYPQIPNASQIHPQYLKRQFDPQNKYSLPYDWGTTGIAVNRTLYSGSIKSWKDLFKNEDLAGKLTLLDDAREVIGAALKSLGYSLNSTHPKELQQAKEVLLKVRNRVKAFTSEPMVPLSNSETAVAHVFMSDALQARKASGGKVDYFIPEEGGTFWMDNLVIPVGAGHLKEAHALLNYLLEPSTVASTTTRLFLAPANRDAIPLLSEELRNNSMLFPSKESLSRTEMFQDLGESLVLWDRIWTEVKAGQD
jgi:spermidine/putrescine transport system substrate-binding protein